MAAAAGFCISVIAVLSGSLNSPPNINTTIANIETVMFLRVNFVLHTVFFEIGAIPTNLITSRD